MNLSAWEEQNFIEAPAIEELLRLLKGESPGIHLEAKVRLDAALQALKDGLSLTEVIDEAVCQLEKYVIAKIIECTNGNKAETARILKVDYKTLYRKMYKYFDTFSDFDPEAVLEKACEPTNERVHEH